MTPLERTRDRPAIIAEVTGRRSIAGPCRSRNGLLSTKPATLAWASGCRDRSRSSHNDTMSPPAEWPYTRVLTGWPGRAVSPMMARARPSSMS